jgi:2-polyprenyl-6-methoxyphenol hydroxylase-like FAD-dependent oxidoreductase
VQTRNRSENPIDPVLIIGAGPTGLVLAIELARRGVPLHLIDQRPAPLPWDRAAIVKSRTLEIFESLGLSAAFLRRGKKIRGADFYGPGSRKASLPLHDLDSPFPFTLGLSESVTEHLLTDALERLGGAVERGVEFVDLKADDTGVQVRVRDRGDERLLAAGWVVGTDGLHSKVRDAVGIAFTGHDYPMHWGVVDARFADWPHADDVIAAMFDPLLMPIPIDGDRWRMYFRADPADTVQVAHIERWLSQLAPGARLVDPDEPQLFHAHSRIATRFRAGRVLFAGDAAHACSPIEAHGMNTGIGDSFNLGWKLALVAAGQAPDSLLDSYDPERRQVAETVGASGDHAEANAAKGGAAAFDAIAAALVTVDDQHKAALASSEIGFGYDASPILGPRSAPPPSPSVTMIGYRVGDAGPLVGRAGAVRLHELLTHTGHTLLLLTGGADVAATGAWLDMARRVAGRYGPHVKAFVVAGNGATLEPDTDDLLVDTTGAAHARLGGDEGPCLCLVRPDGHLGLRCTPPTLAMVDAYLARIFL